MDRPEFCTLTLVSGNERPGIMLPAFTFKYNTDQVIELFDLAEAARLDYLAVSNECANILLTTYTHVHCDCGNTEETRIQHSVDPESAQSFFKSVATSECFIWIVSTPSFEGRALVDTRTNDIVTKDVFERSLH